MSDPLESPTYSPDSASCISQEADLDRGRALYHGFDVSDPNTSVLRPDLSYDFFGQADAAIDDFAGKLESDRKESLPRKQFQSQVEWEESLRLARGMEETDLFFSGEAETTVIQEWKEQGIWRSDWECPFG